MSRTIVYNDLERVQRGRASRLPARVDSSRIKKAVEILGLILLFALAHIQIQTRILQTSSSLAVAQRDYLSLQNAQRDMTQQVAGLKDPARIHRLALSIGMVPPQEQRFAQVYSAPWAADVKPASDVRRADASIENGKVSLWAKLFAFSSQAEAKTTVE